MRALVVGGGAREHAIAQTLARSECEIVVVSPNRNPGLERLARRSSRRELDRLDAIAAFARTNRVDFAVIGPEAPLEAGLSDALRAAGIPAMGPSRAAARIETSKRFCRELLAKYRIDVSPRVVSVQNLDEVDARVAEFRGPFVVKPVGLSGGKGVGVFGVDFNTPEDGASYAKRILASGVGGGQGVLLEEKIEGEEFSLMAFVTDSGIYPMPAVQDYKRALEGDQGGNTGGMGSYSQRDHLLPFLSTSMRDRALEVLKRIVEALRREGLDYRGVLYGGFMLTASGPMLLECNARFGDPEALNVLALYEEGDFESLLYGVAVGRVDPNWVRFRLRATACQYVVPVGYGGASQAGAIVELDEPAIDATGVHLFFGAVEEDGPGRVRLGPSRGVALVGEASAIHEAGARVETALKYVRGTFYVRRDIATKADLTRHVEHMRRLLAPGSKPSPLPLSVAPPDAPPSSAGPPTPAF